MSGTQYLRDHRSPVPKNEAVSRVMSANKGKDTTPELSLRKATSSGKIRQKTPAKLIISGYKRL